MKIVCFSDLHGQLDALKWIEKDAKSADILISAGDLTNFGKRKSAIQILQKLIDINENVISIPGNCDTLEVNDVLTENGTSIHGKGKTIDNIGFFGVGGSNITPFNTPQEYTENYLVDLLESGYNDVKNNDTKVMVCHPPPYDTKIDLTNSGIHVGSKGVREFLMSHSVSLVICGHVHEARGHDIFEKSTIVNPGPANVGYSKINLDDKIKIKFIDY
tara:strand:+ start:1022 stop:1672 length:651 start_codon:yes stop_codon:yes gene_type:complete